MDLTHERLSQRRILLASISKQAILTSVLEEQTLASLGRGALHTVKVMAGASGVFAAHTLLLALSGGFTSTSTL